MDLGLYFTQGYSCQNLAGGPGVRNDRGRGNFQCRLWEGLVQQMGGFNPLNPPGNYNPDFTRFNGHKGATYAAIY
jgi:hypothetical protein